MNELSQLWLQMLLIVAGLGAIGQLRQGWRWNGPGVLQMAILAAIAGWGLLKGPAGTCAGIGWGLYLLLTLWPPVLLRRIQQHVSVLDTTSALEEATRLRMFYWNGAGRFWYDIALSVADELNGESQAARQRLVTYLQPPTPPSFRALALANLQNMRAIAREWDAIVADFELLVPQDGSVLPTGIAATVQRAYLERGQVLEALAVLKREREGRSDGTSLGVRVQAVTFYALAGATVDLEEALAETPLPDYVSDSWRARCAMANDDAPRAVDLMDQALANVPEDQPRLRERLVTMQHELPTYPRTALAPDTADAVSAAREILARQSHAAGILAPPQTSFATVALVAVVALAFIPAHLFELLPSDTTLGWHDWIQAHGELSGAALHGEAWRLVTYLVLHADIFHVGFNMLVLWMFGRQAENLFGPWGVVAVFLCSGVLGGLGQLQFAPHTDAIGASGAVLGVFGAVIGGIWRSHETLARPVRKEMVQRLATVAALQLMLDQVFAGHVAVYIHASGMATGAVIGLLWPLRRASTSSVTLGSLAPRVDADYE